MRARTIYEAATGGTVGSGRRADGARDVDPNALSSNQRVLRTVPFTKYVHVPVTMVGDSSLHAREQLLEFGRAMVHYAGEKDGSVASHGSDTLNLTAATLALMGNELWLYTCVLYASMKGPDKTNSDAPFNTFAAGFFAAYGNGSGVFAVRPNGVIITSRHDTPGGSVDWHGRGIPQAPNAY